MGAYILSNQRLRFPFIQESPKKIDAVLSNAQAVQPGQGQSVRVAGVTIGAIGPVKLKDGRAVVTLEIEPKYKELVKDDATALLRSKTGLKDMFVEVDPGHGKTLEDGGRIALSDTLPDVNLDEVLAVLDSDTRPYLQLLVNGGGKGLDGRGEDLSKTLRQLGPLQRDTRRVSGALAQRKANLRRLINRYGRLTQEVGASDRDLVRLVRASNVVFSAFAEQRDSLSSAVAQLPGTLRQTQTTLNDVRDFSTRLGPALQALRPTVRQLDPATRALLPLAREGTPIVRDRLRPLARATPARLNTLGAAAGDLARAGPDLTTSLGKVNRLLNMAAFNPGGAESLDGQDVRPAAQPPGGLSVLGRLGGPDRRLAVRHRRRPGRVPPLHARQLQLRNFHRLRLAAVRDHPPRQRGALFAVIKETPSPGRILAMVAFAFSCVGILLFLWLSFGGPVPLRSEGYRFKVAVPEATSLAVESDVRISGVNVGKVKSKELSPGGNRTLLEVEIKPRYAPLPRDLRAILRQKTLLGETYLEISPGDSSGPKLADGGRVADAQVQPTVELDEIFGVFTPRTRKAFQQSGAEFAKAFSGRRGQALNDSLGNLEGTATAGERLLSVLNDQRTDLRRFVRNGSVVLGALNDRRGALRGVIVNSNDTFGALASRDRELSETIAILPTFLRESRATLKRLERFTDNSEPVVTRPATGGRRPGPDRARPARAGARPEGHVQVAGPPDHELADRRCRR